VTEPLIARFSVDGFEPAELPGLDGDWVGMLWFAKTFTDGITGTARTAFLSSGPEGTRSYVATERVTGRPDGASDDGSVTIHHGGLESDPTTWFGHIVPGTGTGPFEGWSGSARIVHDEQGPFFRIERT
jgi:hypothetical protein